MAKYFITLLLFFTNSYTILKTQLIAFSSYKCFKSKLDSYIRTLDQDFRTKKR